jgi:hypothetical protein
MTLLEWEKRVNLGSMIQKTFSESLAEAPSTPVAVRRRIFSESLAEATATPAARRRVSHIPPSFGHIPTVTGWETSSSGAWVRSWILS